MRRTRPVVWSHGDKINKHLSHFYMQLTNFWSKVCKILQNKWKSHKPMTSQGNGYPKAFNSTKALWGLPTSHSCYRARIKRQLYSQPEFMDPSTPIKPKRNKSVRKRSHLISVLTLGLDALEEMREVLVGWTFRKTQKDWCPSQPQATYHFQSHGRVRVREWGGRHRTRKLFPPLDLLETNHHKPWCHRWSFQPALST